MAEADEVSKIMAVADKYSDYFNEWHSDIAIGRKEPNFFYVYNDKLITGIKYTNICGINCVYLPRAKEPSGPAALRKTRLDAIGTEAPPASPFPFSTPRIPRR